MIYDEATTNHMIKRAEAFRAEHGENSVQDALEKANSLIGSASAHDDRLYWLFIYHYLHNGKILDTRAL
jgi:hypothetical protein